MWQRQTLAQWRPLLSFPKTSGGATRQTVNMAEIEQEEHVDSPEETEPNEAPTPQKKVKKKKKSETEAGVIYLSRIPTGMNVTKVRQVFEQYGEVGRMFIQPDGMGTFIYYRSKGTHVFTILFSCVFFCIPLYRSLYV